MKAYLIDAQSKSLEPQEVSDKDQIAQLIGYETIESDQIGNTNDHLFFDEECFIRGIEGRFQIDKLIPVAGKGIVIGVLEDGALQDVTMDIEDLQSRLKFF
jgi:hypothetical protein